MPDREAIQIRQIAQRAVVRLTAWAPGPPSTVLVPPGLEGEVRLLTFSPREWLAVSDRIEGSKLRTQLVRQAGAEGIAAVDLSCAVKVLRVAGSAARGVLARGCGLDLDPGRFPAGGCTRTRLAQLAIIVHCGDSALHFNLYVGRSHFEYLHAWLVDSAAEFQASDLE